jgi:molybdopterin-biosynthesis enzyme MoeA-like protein
MMTSPPTPSPAAFGVECTHDADALALLGAHYAERGLEFTEARRRMARMPVGSQPHRQPVSRAPGFVIGNVHVMAGVPSVFQAMLDNVLPTLNTGVKVLSDKVSCPYGEGDIGDALSRHRQGPSRRQYRLLPAVFRRQGFQPKSSFAAAIRPRSAAARLDVEAMLADNRTLETGQKGPFDKDQCGDLPRDAWLA